MTRIPLRRLAATLALSVLPLSACGSLPADAEGTYDRARDGTLVVGVSEHPPWTSVDPDIGEVTGSEAELIKGFAETINAEIDWQPGPESVLAGAISEGEVDIVIGGLTTAAPWSSQMAMTRAYTSAETEDGSTEEMVMGVPLGENELMVELERYLAQEHGEI